MLSGHSQQQEKRPKPSKLQTGNPVNMDGFSQITASDDFIATSKTQSSFVDESEKVSSLNIDNQSQKEHLKLELEDVLLTSYVRNTKNAMFQCIITTRKMIICHQNKIISSLPLRNLSVASSVKCFVYSSYNVILTIHTDCIKLWCLQDKELSLVNQFSNITGFKNYDFRLQNVAEDTTVIRRAVVIGFDASSCLVKVFQLTLSQESSTLIFQQNILLEGEILNLEIFPSPNKYESVSYFIVEMDQKSKLFTIDMSYIKNAADYLLDDDLVDYVNSLQITSENVVINKPASFSIKNGSYSSGTSFIIDEYQIKMGDYYYNLLSLFKGDLPLAVNDLASMPFGKFLNVQMLDSDTQSFFKNIAQLQSSYTECSLVYHKHFMVSIMFYNRALIGKIKPKYFTLTCIKDLKSITLCPSFENDYLSILINTSCKIRHGIIRGTVPEKLVLKEYDFISSEKKGVFKTYLNITEPCLIYTFIPMAIKDFFMIKGDIAFNDSSPIYKRYKVVPSSKQDHYYFVYQLNAVCDRGNFIATNLVTGNQNRKTSFYHYNNSEDGLLFIEYGKSKENGFSIKKLFVNGNNSLQQKTLLKIKDHFGEKQRCFDINFFKDLIYSDQISGVISYQNEKHMNIFQFFGIKDGKLTNEYIIEVDNDIVGNNQDSQYTYRKSIKEKTGMPCISIERRERTRRNTTENGSLLKTFITNSFNPDFKIVWALTDHNLHLLVRVIEGSSGVLFASLYKDNNIEPKKWLNSDRWTVSTDGNSLSFFDDKFVHNYYVTQTVLLAASFTPLKIKTRKVMIFDDIEQRSIVFTKNVELGFSSNVNIVVFKQQDTSALSLTVVSDDSLSRTLTRSGSIDLGIGSSRDTAPVKVVRIVVLNPSSLMLTSSQTFELALLMIYEEGCGLMNRNIKEFRIPVCCGAS